MIHQGLLHVATDPLSTNLSGDTARATAPLKQKLPMTALFHKKTLPIGRAGPVHREHCGFFLFCMVFLFLLGWGLILRCVFALELQLKAVCDEGDEFRVRGFSLGVGNGVAEEALEGIQVFIALLVGLMPYDLLGYRYSSIESTKTQLFCICAITYIKGVNRLQIYGNIRENHHARS